MQMVLSWYTHPGESCTLSGECFETIDRVNKRWTPGSDDLGDFGVILGRVDIVKAESINSKASVGSYPGLVSGGALSFSIPAFARGRAIPPVWSLLVNGGCALVCVAAALVLIGWLRS